MSAITSAKSKLGFVGIGYMGRPIAQRLLKSGFRLTAYDRHRTKAEELIRYGGTVAENVAELSSSCDVVLTCLASDEAVLNIYKTVFRQLREFLEPARLDRLPPKHRRSVSGRPAATNGSFLDPSEVRRREGPPHRPRRVPHRGE